MKWNIENLSQALNFFLKLENALAAEFWKYRIKNILQMGKGTENSRF